MIPSPTGGLRLGLSGGASLHCTLDTDNAPCCCGAAGCCIWNRSSCDEAEPLTCCECGQGGFDVVTTGSLKREQWNPFQNRLETVFSATWTITARTVCVSPNGDSERTTTGGQVKILVNKFFQQDGLRPGTWPGKLLGGPNDFTECGASIRMVQSTSIYFPVIATVLGVDRQLPNGPSHQWRGYCNGTDSFFAETWVLQSTWACLSGGLTSIWTNGDPNNGGDRDTLMLAWNLTPLANCNPHPCGNAGGMTCVEFLDCFERGLPCADLNGDGFIDPQDYFLYLNQHPDCGGNSGGAVGARVRLLVSSGVRIKVGPAIP